ncbi:MAG: hypothetical protein K2W96_20805, partial [Gemmataceae bacterium]|nr:hypothetical protein [Gemmataceae bacterium]
MRYAIRCLVYFLSRLFLSLRYRVRIKGMEKLRGLGRKGKVLVLPNHPAYSDPLILLSHLGPTLDPRPLVYEGTYANPVMWPFMKIINALRVPDMESASSSARETAQASVQAIIDGLKAGSNHILWPSGRLQRDGEEVLGGARALTDILQAVPDAEIVLVRTRGLWGSMFSFATTGQLPSLSGRLLGGLWVLLSNLFLFTPRREITLTVEVLDRSKLPELQREKVNAFFEAWYNAEGKEPPTYRPYHFLFGRRTFDYPPRPAMDDLDLSRVRPEVKAEVLAMLADKVKRPLDDEERKPEATLDLIGLDSLDRMEFALQVEQRFGFSTDQVPSTVGQLWALAGG